MGLISNGTTLLDGGSLDSGVATGAMTLLQTITASSGTSTVDFTSNIDSTYKEYIVKYINVHSSGDDVSLRFQADTGTNTDYNLASMSTFYAARNREDDGTGTGVPAVQYWTNRDQDSNGTGFIRLHYDTGNINDNCLSGILHLFNPSSSTFMKHFMSVASDAGYSSSGAAQASYVAGYFNTTTAVTRLRFKFNSGDIDSGTFKLYGVL